MHAESYRRHNKDERHSSLGKYISHFIWKGSKGFAVWEVNWRLNRTATYWTPTLVAITAFLCRSPGLLNRGLGAQPLWDMFLIPASSLQLTRTSCRRGYIIFWRPLFFLRASQFCSKFNPSKVKIISWYTSTRYSCYLHRCISYFDSLAGSEVNIQQTDCISVEE